MPDDEHQRKFSAAQKMRLLKSQQAKLEIRAMPAHSQLKLKEYDKKMKKKRKKKKIATKKSRKTKLSPDPADSSSSSLSKLSLASSGSGAAIPRSSSHKSDVQHPAPKDEQANVLKWKRRTEYIYEAERISIKLKEIAAECEKDIALRLAIDDIVARVDTLKRAHDEYYQYVQAQNDIFDKQIKLLDEIQAMQITELRNKMHRLSNIFKNIDVKLSAINAKLQNIANQQAQKTLLQNFIEITCTIF